MPKAPELTMARTVDKSFSISSGRFSPTSCITMKMYTNLE
jgi:hypothetical protein